MLVICHLPIMYVQTIDLEVEHVLNLFKESFSHCLEPRLWHKHLEEHMQTLDSGHVLADVSRQVACTQDAGHVLPSTQFRRWFQQRNGCPEIRRIKLEHFPKTRRRHVLKELKTL